MARQMKDSGVEWIGEIPEEWGVLPLGNCFDERNEKVSDYDWEPLSVTKQGIVKQLETAAKSDAHDARKKVCEKDFVINSRSDRKQSCGISTYDGSVSLINIVLSSRFLKTEYVKYLLKNYGFAEEFYRWGTGIVADLWSTKYERMKKIMLPIPNEAEQQKIAEFLDEKVGEIDSVIAKTKETIEDYKKYKQAIITDAVTKGLNPDVEMKESKSSYLGMIPAHWIEKRLRFLGMCQNGISKSSEYFGEGYAFVSYGDVYKNYALPERGSGLIKSSEEDRNIYSVQYGDVFFTRTSETIEEVGFASTCLKSIANATFAGFVIRFRPNNQEELLPEFSKYYFRSDVHRKFFVKEMNLVTRASLSQELLKKLPVLLPPLEEQRKIAEYLDKKCSEIDKLISKKEELLVDLEDYKKSLIYEYVTGKKEVE